MIVGASRGLGLGFSIGLSDPGDTMFLVSRTRPPSLDRADQVSRIWIQADLSSPQTAAVKVAEAIGDRSFPRANCLKTLFRVRLINQGDYS